MSRSVVHTLHPRPPIYHPGPDFIPCELEAGS
jgi:hypothetical protein